MKQFFTKTIIVRRLKNVGTDKRNLQATATVDASVQNVDDALIGNAAGITSRTFKRYADIDDDIQTNDQIEDSDNGLKYLVKTVNKKDYGALQHLEILADRMHEE